MTGGRRSALRAALALAALVAGVRPAAAQVGASVEATRAAREWLALTDAGDGAGSWKAAGLQFRNAITADRWSEALAAVRRPLGALGQRTVLSTRLEKAIPGAPDGDYAVVLFRTSFAQKADGGETVTLAREQDGRWRVVGYFVE